MHPRKLALIIAVLAALLLAACGGDDTNDDSPSQTERPVIRLAVNQWTASELNVAVARILLEDQLGYTVETVAVDEYAQWPQLASGDLHASLEVWPSGHVDQIQQYIDTEQTVTHGGNLGVTGQIGWFVPVYVVADVPALRTWEGFLDPENVALFATEDSGGQGVFWAGDPGWTQYDEQIIANLGLDLVIERLGSEEALLAAVDTAYTAGDPFLMYFWTPHWVHALYDLTMVQLPEYSEQCYATRESGGVDCAYPSDTLIKVFWSGLADYAPDAHHVLQQFTLTNLDQIHMMAAVQLDDVSVEDAAQTWIDQNETTWRAWLPAE